MSADELIYLDYNATSPLDPRVLDAMLPFLRDSFGNAASRHHRLGREAADAVDQARARVCALLGADDREIVWTSGATESNNLALKGLAESPAYVKKRHIVTVRTEHRAVLDPCEFLEGRGYEVTFLPVDGSGVLDLDRLRDALRADTLVASVMHGNNEIGVLHPIAEIGRLCRERGVLFHTDATQTFGKEPIDVEAMAVDLLSFSAHKLCGPKGVGGLFVRRRGPRVRCAPAIHGGGHERGLRSGTLNVPGIVGLGAAAEVCANERDTEQPRIRALRDRLEQGLLDAVEGVVVNAKGAPRLANTSNVSFPGQDADDLLERVPEIAASTASACTSATLQPSYVLGALGLSEARVRGSVRFSLGRFTTGDEIDRALACVVVGIR